METIVLEKQLKKEKKKSKIEHIGFNIQVHMDLVNGNFKYKCKTHFG